MCFVKYAAAKMYQWLRLNVYSLLIAAGGLLLTAMALSAVFYRIAWIWALLLFCCAAAAFRMAWGVFAKYSDKRKTMERLKAKLAKGYDKRYFLPYMGSACYRHVVYFTLADAGLAARYRDICRHYRTLGVQRDNPRTTKFKIVDGRIVFEESGLDDTSGVAGEL